MDFAADAREMIADLYGTVTYGVDTVNASFGTVRREDDVSSDGVLNEADLQVSTVRTDWTTLPAPRSVLTITISELGLSEVAYHITSREVDAGTATFQLRRV